MEKDSAAENAGLISGDQIIAVNDISSNDIDGKTAAAGELRKMINNTTKIVIKREYILDTKELYVTKSNPSGLGIADFDAYNVRN